MKLNVFIPDFEEWYLNREKEEDYYNKYINKDKLESIDNEEFIKFFVDFYYDGGKIQSGGKRNYIRFENTIRSNIDKFRIHILKPFYFNFDIKDWLIEIKDFPFWGKGIATIYLSRLNKYKFPIVNSKTFDVISSLTHKNISAVSLYDVYIRIKLIQKFFIYNYDLNNYLKVDGFFEFLNINLKKLKKIWSKNDSKLLNINLNKLLIEDEIYESEDDKLDIIREIKDISNSDNKIIEYNGKRYSRNFIITEKIKKLREYKCQFCNKTILKKDGTKYIEACHIKPKSKGGGECINNILILCPNCHKEFDLGNRYEEWISDSIYKVNVNGNSYKIIFEK